MTGAGGSTAVAAWDPSSLGTALKTWYRADSLSATPVTSWPDKSGNGNTIVSATAAPSWSATGAANGQADVIFTRASSTSLNTSANVTAGIGTGDFSLGMVFRPAATNVSQVMAMTGLTNTYEMGILNTGVLWLYNNGTHTLSTSVSANTWYSLILQRVSGTTSVWLNGVQDPNTYAITGSVGDNKFYVGWDGANYFGGDIPEVFLSTQSLDTAGLNNWFGYTHSRYGI